MEQKTHLMAKENLLGSVKKLEEGSAEVVLRTNREMVVDEKGLVHGGFTFGLADYAAMLAVNKPYVVLASSSIKFLKPVKSGDMLRAEARVSEREGKKTNVLCDVFNQKNEKVFEGEFGCFVLDSHVSER